MPPADADGCSGVHVVDTNLFGIPGVMSAYVLDAVRPAIVDPGAAPAVDILLAALHDLDVAPGDVEYVIPTHVHLDHAGATGALARECPNATVLVHERGREYLVDRDRLDHLVASARRAMGDVADAYGDPEPVAPERCEPIADGDEIDLGDRRLRAVDAPGHAPHQAALFDARDGALFAADAAGMTVDDDLVPTTPPPDFDLATSLATIDRLAALDPRVICYGHFGVETDALAALERYGALLPRWVEAVEAAVGKHGPDRAAVVESLRPEWPMPTLESDVAGVMRSLEGT